MIEVKEFKFAKLSEQPTIEEIDKEIKRLGKLERDYHNEEQAIKIFLNSMYGALASQYFMAANTDMAEAITLQGQNIIQTSATLLDNYFKNFWHKDKDLHKKLGITKVAEVTCEVAKYGDTDSVYATLQEAFLGTDYQKEPYQFVLDVYEYRLKDYLQKGMEKLAEKYNTKNIQKFELETISRSMLLIAKKKYILDIAWQAPDIFYGPQQKIKPKGVEIVQSSTPIFSRKILKDILKVILTEKKDLNVKEFIKQLRVYKEKFLTSEISDIALQAGINDYAKGIANDTEKFEVNSRCPIYVRAAGYYNYLINNNPKLKKKYSLIKTGDKVKFYYSTDHFCNVFAFPVGQWCPEIAPSIDYDAHFQRVLLDAVNRLIKPLGFPGFDSDLIISKKLF